MWESRGNLQEAIRLGERDIARKRAEIDAGDFAPYPKLLLEEAEYLRDGLAFQAERYLKVGDKARAADRLREVSALSERYGLDEDVRALFEQLKH